MIIATAVLWWMLLQLFALAGLPLAFRLCGWLPDRGYALARPLGLLLTGYVLWMGGSLGFWQNGVSATVAALGIVVATGWWLYVARRNRDTVSLLAWLRAHKAYVLSVELLFGVALLGWTVFKAHNPNLETAGGEKWMEIAFVNSLLRSGGFPPPDPWLSGFGISYYYFGYVLMAMVTRLSGLGATVAYNLFAPSLFALTLSGAFSLTYNLVAGRRHSTTADTPPPCEQIRTAPAVSGNGMLYGLVGAMFVGVLGNLEGLLEVLHSRGLLSAGFWRWLDIKDINVPAMAGGWVPDRFMWWWRASRVIHDCSFQGLASGNCNPPGGDWEVIDEFPFFSFLLGDVHPHVLALPFVLLALALTLNLFLGLLRAHPTAVEAARPGATDFRRLIVGAFGGWLEFFLVAVCLGALGFLNTWDFPIYLGGLTAAFALARAWRVAPDWPLEAAGIGTILAAAGAVLYMPFYMGFQSQAGGLLPNLFNPTRLVQFIVFFGPFLFIIVSYLVLLARRTPLRARLGRLPAVLGVTLLGPLLAMVALVPAALVSPATRQLVDGLLNNPELRPLLGQPTVGSLVELALRIRMGNPWTWLLLGGLLAGVALCWPGGATDEQGRAEGGIGHTDGFALVLIGLGVLLPLVVEFVYLRDNFGIRMNTVFKLYFQTWVLLAVAAAYGLAVLEDTVLRGSGSLRGLVPATVWRLAMLVLVGAGLVYPLLAVPNKMAGYDGASTLDGMAWVERVNPDDYAAIRWLQANARDGAVVLEAPGDHYAAYDYVSRVSALTGLPTLLGWGNHEHQWRGSYVEPARREPDIEALFNGLDMQRTRALLDQYAITYVYVGQLERQRYSPAGLAKFADLMTMAYQGGSVTIYERR